jgi:uncharacterized protein DUF3485
VNRFIVLGLILWGAYGIRLVLDHFVLTGLAPVPLEIPFSEYPMEAVGPGWEGRNLPLEDAIRERAGVSDFILRKFRRNDRTLWLYVGYVSGATPQGIHHPGVCFPASGHALSQGRRVTLPVAGFADPPVFKEYVWTHLEGGTAYTLTTFHYNGAFDPEEWRLRAAPLFGLRYFAVITVSVQVHGSVEETRQVCEEVLRRALPPLLRHFPGEGMRRTTK